MFLFFMLLSSCFFFFKHLSLSVFKHLFCSFSCLTFQSWDVLNLRTLNHFSSSLFSFLLSSVCSFLCSFLFSSLFALLFSFLFSSLLTSIFSSLFFSFNFFNFSCRLRQRNTQIYETKRQMEMVAALHTPRVHGAASAATCLPRFRSRRDGLQPPFADSHL